MKSKKKALIVVSLAGFIRSFLNNDIKILQDKGYEIYCATNIDHPGSEGMLEYFKNNNIIFFNVPFSSNSPISKQTIQSYNVLKKILKNENFDLVHCHTPIVGVLTRILCRNIRKIGTKVIYTTHGFYFHDGSSKKTWTVFYTIEKLMSKYCDAIITINNEDFKNATTMHCKNVYKINGVGVDLKRFNEVSINRDEYRRKLGIKPDDIVVLSVGELSKRKNQKVVVEAIAKLNDPNIVFLHCGNVMNSKGTKDHILQIAKQNNVRIKLMGLRNDIPYICRCADIGTISSTREGLGLAGIEMLASGLPVVASNTHGIKDYMQDGINGYLVNPYSSADFAVAIEKIINMKNREEIKKICKESVQNFSKEISYNQLKSIYDEVLN